jgi:hypothetical protein
MYKVFETPTLEREAGESPWQLYEGLSSEQKGAFLRLMNNAGLPDDVENLFDIYCEDHPGSGEKELQKLLGELKNRLPGTGDFQSKAEEIIDLIK